MMESEINLRIEDSTIKCRKKLLIENSDYFNVMINGNFAENGKNTITLECVDLHAMQIILKLLEDETYTINQEYLLLVLETACMLQFIEIKNKCVDLITEMISPENCLRIWMQTEKLNINPLWIKSKCMALEEFSVIRETDCLLELNLENLLCYLGNIHLKTKSEVLVFETAMKWWYENSKNFKGMEKSILLKLLSTIDINSLSHVEIKELNLFPDITSNEEISNIILCIDALKRKEDKSKFEHEHIQLAEKLCKSNKRRSVLFPCFLIKKYKNVEFESTDTMVYYDKYKRKRLSTVFGACSIDKLLVYFDYKINNLKMLLSLEDKCRRLDGYKLMAYKEFIFLYGGEYSLGKGEWNVNFWVYDTIRERWERKSVMPFKRRHFMSCIVGDYLYIVGGFGSFRKIQNNIFYYKYKEDLWSKQLDLPEYGWQFKCCEYLDKLLIFYENTNSCYVFQHPGYWVKIGIVEGHFANISPYKMFYYKNRLYFKMRVLFEYKLIDSVFKLISNNEIYEGPDYDNAEIVVCEERVFSLYEFKSSSELLYTLEEYNLETGEIKYIFKDRPKFYDGINIDGIDCSSVTSVLSFSYRHPRFVEGNDLINKNFL